MTGSPCWGGGTWKRIRKSWNGSPACSIKPSTINLTSGGFVSSAVLNPASAGSATRARATTRWPAFSGNCICAAATLSSGASGGISAAAASRAQRAKSDGGRRREALSLGRTRLPLCSRAPVRPGTPVASSTSLASLQFWRSKRTARILPLSSSHCSSQYSMSGV